VGTIPQSGITLPVGIFDSGVGGLTVLTALRRRLPAEHFLYLGDTARLPYGAKSPETITRYALQASRSLVERRVKLLVVACNTASAVALDTLRSAFAPLPVIGVVEPGAAASCAASPSGRIAVIATESTVRGKAYEQAIQARRPDALVRSLPCPLFVALAEEGWTEGPLVEAIVQRYLCNLFVGPENIQPECLVLGCTHFPILAGAIQNVVGNNVTLVDSAETTAEVVAQELRNQKLLRPMNKVAGETTFLATDGPERFARVGSIFLKRLLSPAEVTLVDL
jgi:glutamate racemase